MKGKILDHRVAIPEQAHRVLHDGGVLSEAELAVPSRPAAVPGGSWRRMTRLARLLVPQVLELHAANPGVSWETMPLVWGTAKGEVVPSTSFLDRILVQGGAFGSPTAFQNSVYNSTPGHVSMVLGMRGLAETVSAGQASALAALHRGLSLLQHHEHVLVCVGEDLCEASRLSWSHAGGVAGEAVVSMLLERGDELQVDWGVHHGSGPRICRQARLAWERDDLPTAEVVPEQVCGHTVAAGLATWLVLGEGSLVEVDGLTGLTARRR